MNRIPVAGPSITDLELAYVADAARNGWYEEAGTFLTKFEAAFALHTKRRHAVALPSCTSALHLALAAIGVGTGDEVIVPDCTWIASAAPIQYVGGSAVLADIDRRTWCLSPESFEDAITPATKAVIVVDLYGHMPDWDRIVEIADRYGIVVIEDAAEAIGSTYRGRPAGSFGAFSTFSFHGSKTLTTGEGGMLVCDDDKLFARVQKLRDHGRIPGDVMFFNDEVAFKYKMSPIQAALGLAQLERLDELVAIKRQIFGWYQQFLGHWNAVQLNPDFEQVHNSYWMSTTIVDPSLGLRKEKLIPALKARGVDVRPFFYPLSAIPAYSASHQAARARQLNRVAYEVSATGINLPSALRLNRQDVETVSNILKEVVGALGSRFVNP